MYFNIIYILFQNNNLRFSNVSIFTVSQIVIAIICLRLLLSKSVNKPRGYALYSSASSRRAWRVPCHGALISNRTLTHLVRPAAGTRQGVCAVLGITPRGSCLVSAPLADLIRHRIHVVGEPPARVSHYWHPIDHGGAAVPIVQGLSSVQG